MARIDFPQNPSRQETGTATGGIQDLIDLTSVATFPNPTVTGRATTNEVPYNAFDVRRCRMLSVQLSSYSVTGAGTFQLLVSNDARSYVPLWLFDPSSATWVNQWAIPTGGTTTAPKCTMVLVDIPWFAWLKFSINAGAATGSGWLTIYKRD